VNNCNEELDNGQFIVQIKSKEAHQRIQIAHLRVGAPTPQVTHPTLFSKSWFLS